MKRHKEEAKRCIFIVEDDSWPEEEIVKTGARKRAEFHTQTASALEALQAERDELRLLVIASSTEAGAYLTPKEE